MEEPEYSNLPINNNRAKKLEKAVMSESAQEIENALIEADKILLGTNIKLFSSLALLICSIPAGLSFINYSGIGMTLSGDVAVMFASLCTCYCGLLLSIKSFSSIGYVSKFNLKLIKLSKQNPATYAHKPQNMFGINEKNNMQPELAVWQKYNEHKAVLISEKNILPNRPTIIRALQKSAYTKN